jgi:hypothetical protein|tara:strand:+ start:180 stop:413 length:234 start_codon:yes stop_codon:yes gene_type:complete
MKKISLSETDVIYNQVFKTMTELCKHHDPLAVSGVLLAQALRLYKTALPMDDFDLLIDEIMETVKEDIRPFDTPTLN